MKNRNRQILIFTLTAVVFLASPSYAFEAVGEDNTTVTDSASMGTVGTAANPIKSVDGTGIRFDEWAGGLYFTPDCEYLNITEEDGAIIRLVPVYEPETRTVTVLGGGGKFGGNSSAACEVNFIDGTIDSAKEILAKDDKKDLGEVLSALTPVYEGFYPYFYSFESSGLNKRIFVNKDDPAKAEQDDADLETAVYDRPEDCEITLVWKDNEDPEDWNAEQKENAAFIAAADGMQEAEYHSRFGGSTEVPYGRVAIEKKLPGAEIGSCTWTLVKDAVIETRSGTALKEYTKTGMDGSFDGAELTEKIDYGGRYRLVTVPLTFTAYQRPAIDAFME